MPSKKVAGGGAPSSAGAVGGGGVLQACGGTPLELCVTVSTKHRQEQNGLKFQDFRRYRLYNSKLLKHCRGALHFKHGKRQFHARNLPEQVNDSRYLKMLLLLAERAWSYASELKMEAASSGYNACKLRRRSLKRFRKALQYARQLEGLCATFASGKTYMDAQSYAAWMSALVLMELEDWSEALECLRKAHTLVSQLRLFATNLNEERAFQLRLEDFEPYLRLCQFNLKTSSIDGKQHQRLKKSSEVPVEENVKEAAPEGGTLRELFHRGRRIAVPTEKLWISFSACRQKLEENCISTEVFGDEKLAVSEFLDDNLKSEEAIVSTYDEIFNLFNTTLLEFQSDILQGCEFTFSDLEAFQEYVSDFQRLISIERTILLALTFLKGISLEASLKQIRSEEGLRFADILKQELEKMYQRIDLDDESNEISCLFTFCLEAVKCCRATFLSLLFASLERFAEAQQLIRWVLAKKMVLKSKSFDSSDLFGRLNGLFNRLLEFIFLQANRLLSVYLYHFVKDANTSMKERFEAKPLDMEKLKSLTLADGVSFPPQPEMLECRALLLDMASTSYQAPDISHRLMTADQPAAGLIGRLKAWWS